MARRWNTTLVLLYSFFFVFSPLPTSPSGFLGLEFRTGLGSREGVGQRDGGKGNNGEDGELHFGGFFFSLFSSKEKMLDYERKEW